MDYGQSSKRAVDLRPSAIGERVWKFPRMSLCQRKESQQCILEVEKEDRHRTLTPATHTPREDCLPGSFESKWEVMHPLGQCLVMVYLEPSIMEALPSIPFGREVSCLSPL